MTSIRHPILIDANNREVWQALTTAEGLKGWWPEVQRADARAGGKIVIAWDAEDPASEDRGTFHAVQPTRNLEILWDARGGGTMRGSRLQFQIGRGDGETKVLAIETLRSDATEEDREAREAWWKDALARLRGVFEG